MNSPKQKESIPRNELLQKLHKKINNLNAERYKPSQQKINKLNKEVKLEDVEKVIEDGQEIQEEIKERDDLFMQMGNRDDDDDDEALLKDLEAEMALDQLGNLPSVPKNEI